MSAPAPLRPPRDVARDPGRVEPPRRTREAALLLHALAPADREWLIAQLPDAERAPLRAHLDELRAIGIPADRALVEQVVAAPRAATAAAPTDGGDDAMRALEEARAAEIAELLAGEPPFLVAQLLRVKDWTWSRALLRRLGAAERAAVERELARAAAPRTIALQRHLVGALARRLAAAPRRRAASAWATLLARAAGRRADR